MFLNIVIFYIFPQRLGGLLHDFVVFLSLKSVLLSITSIVYNYMFYRGYVLIIPNIVLSERSRFAVLKSQAKMYMKVQF